MKGGHSYIPSMAAICCKVRASGLSGQARCKSVQQDSVHSMHSKLVGPSIIASSKGSSAMPYHLGDALRR